MYGLHVICTGREGRILANISDTWQTVFFSPTWIREPRFRTGVCKLSEQTPSWNSEHGSCSIALSSWAKKCEKLTEGYKEAEVCRPLEFST